MWGGRSILLLTYICIVCFWIRSGAVNGIEQAPHSNLARLSAISSFWTLFVGGDFTLPKESHALVFHEGHSIAAIHVQFQLTISFFMHVYSRQALLCARLAACHVPLVYVLFVFG